MLRSSKELYYLFNNLHIINIIKVFGTRKMKGRKNITKRDRASIGERRSREISRKT